MSSLKSQNSTSEETATQKHINALLERIDAFIARKGWTQGYFSKVAAGDTGVVPRLRDEAKVTGAKMIEIEKYLDGQEKATDA
jgi:hypothetical protein